MKNQIIYYLKSRRILIMRLSDIFFWVSIGLILGSIYGVYFTVDYVNLNYTGVERVRM